jgi:hypothetical protein
MTELESILRKKETEELQLAILNSRLIPEGIEIAQRILSERDAEIPTPKPEEELEAEEKMASKKSAKKFLFVAVSIGAWLLYGYSTDWFSHGEHVAKSLFFTGLAIFWALKPNNS